MDIFTTGLEACFSPSSLLMNFLAMKYATFKVLLRYLQRYTIVSSSFLYLYLFVSTAIGQTPEYRLETMKVTLPVNRILPGANQTAHYFPLLKGKKIAVVGNQTSIVFDEYGKIKSHLVDFLLENNFFVVKVFSPEHGFRGDGDAGEAIKSGFDTKTGLPVVSLYGDNKKPKPEQLLGVDIVLFDLQDVGVRFYTYISTLHYVMEACAEAKIPLVVLDRPNPNIDIIDGPVLDLANKSFIGMHPVPVLYGMTIGEYAKMIQGENWIQKKVELTVIPCKNYFRNKSYSLPVPPSPNLRTDNAIAWYASLCLFEGTVVSVGRGTDKPFEQVGHPDYPIKKHSFTPRPGFGSKDPVLNGQLCYGIDFSDSVAPRRLVLQPILDFYRKMPNNEQFFLKNNFFNLLAGNKILKDQIIAGMSEDAIRATWQKDLDAFKKIRAKYLIYE
jgi:uncharacterized protein YbbC (DUF1343 family)